MNIDECIRGFLEDIKNKSPSDHTFISYETDLRQFAEFLEKQEIKTVNLIETSTLREYLRNLFDWGFSKKTISRKLSSLRGFFAYLKKRKILDGNPARGLRGPAAPKNLPRAISEEAVIKMIDAAGVSEEPLRDTAVIELLYGCGLRISELSGLKWQDIDIEERWLVVLGKGDKERRVPFGRYAQKALSELRTQEGEQGVYVFPGERGLSKPLTVRTVHRIITKLAERSGVIGVTPHTLRHSCATHLLERGASLKFVQELLGHENLATTQIYLTISASWMKESYARAKGEEIEDV